jgi:Flp pilus assembly protein TadB
MRRLDRLEPCGPATEVSTAVVLDLLDAACTAGASVPAALAAVGAAVKGRQGRALRRVAGALGLGARWSEAWSEGGEPELAGHLEPVAAALRPTWEDGVAPGGMLRCTSGLLRRERHARALVAAGRLGVQLVLPLGLCHLPAFVLVGLVPVLVSMAGQTFG